MKQRLREQGGDFQETELMRNELEAWKQKFMSLNREYNKVKEELMMC